MKYYKLAVILLFFASCNPGLYFPVKEVPQDAKFIRLDSFSLYTRTVFKQADTSAKIKTNRDTVANEVIEIDYLLLSEEQAIYITSIPDPVQLYYRDNPPSPNTLNIQRFSRFQFGTCNGNEIEFINRNTKSKNTWIIDSTPDTLVISRIIQMKSRSKMSDDFFYEDEISVDLALENRIEFVEQPSFTVVLAYKEKQKKGLPVLADNSIHWTSSGSDLNFRIFLKLDKPYVDDATSSVVSYRKHRIHFPPIVTHHKKEHKPGAGR